MFLTLKFNTMERLTYQITISAAARKVWETMLGKETYEQWVAKAWPGSTYKGKWGQGDQIRFVGADGSGTLAEIVEAKPYESLLATHIAVLGKDGVEDRSSDIAKGWVGTTEGYKFEERNGKTTLTVTIETSSPWKDMFDEGWPVALQDLKALTENQKVTA